MEKVIKPEFMDIFGVFSTFFMGLFIMLIFFNFIFIPDEEYIPTSLELIGITTLSIIYFFGISFIIYIIRIGYYTYKKVEEIETSYSDEIADLQYKINVLQILNKKNGK